MTWCWDGDPHWGDVAGPDRVGGAEDVVADDHVSERSFQVDLRGADLVDAEVVARDEDVLSAPYLD